GGAVTWPGTPGVAARGEAASAAGPRAGVAGAAAAAVLTEAADLGAVPPPRPAPPGASQARSASPPSQRPPGSAGAGAPLDAVVSPPAEGGAAAGRDGEDGPAQDVRSTAAARKLRAALFVMPDGTAGPPFRFPQN